MPLDGKPTIVQPLYHPTILRETDRTAIGYGCGIALAPLQAAVIATGLVNHGLLTPPTMLKRDTTDNWPASITSSGKSNCRRSDNVPAMRIVSEQTSTQMRTLLRHAVSDGTGISADSAGYDVGGKTGTTFKVRAGRYDKQRRTTWFFAGFPMNAAPRYTLLIMLDEPQGTVTTGGKATAQWNAAPTAGRVITELAPLLGIAPATNTSRSL